MSKIWEKVPGGRRSGVKTSVAGGGARAHYHPPRMSETWASAQQLYRFDTLSAATISKAVLDHNTKVSGESKSRPGPGVFVARRDRVIREVSLSRQVRATSGVGTNMSCMVDTSAIGERQRLPWWKRLFIRG